MSGGREHFWIVVAGVALGCVLCAGCETGLETGYKPQKLGTSEAQRRAYYANAFTPEAKPSEKYDAGPVTANRPMPAGGR